MEKNSVTRESSTRPISRRGLRTESAVVSTASSSTPLIVGENVNRSDTNTSHRIMSSAQPLSNIRIGTASRIASAISSSNSGQLGTASSNRIETAIGYADSLMTHRPITQHGLSGLSTSHTRIGTASTMRMVKDKRYWQNILQTKMNEITQEINKLSIEKVNMDREQSTKRMYDKKVKVAAKELTDLQAQLTSMNIALDSFVSGTTRQHLQWEANALREHNETIQNQLEVMFSERQMIDERNSQLKQEIEMEKNKISDMILSLPIEEQAKYEELQNLAGNMKQQNMDKQSKIELLTNQKEKLNGIIMASQVKMKTIRLKQKLQELKKNYNLLRKEKENKLTPEQEREKLISEVRINNQALTSIGHQMKIIEDQLNEKKEQLLLIEQGLEEGDSERHAKYKELKRRDETMTKFLESFPQQIELEKKNVEMLKNQISYAIEQISLQGLNIKSFEISNSDILNEKNDLNSQNGLLKECKRIGIQLKQLQILEKRTSSQLKQLQQEEIELINEIQKYNNLESLRSEVAENIEELMTKYEELKKKKQITEDVKNETKRRNQEIKDQLRNNETYQQIAHLEEKLVDLICENKTLQEIVEENRKINNYKILQSEIEIIMNAINEMLMDDHDNEKFKYTKNKSNK